MCLHIAVLCFSGLNFLLNEPWSIWGFALRHTADHSQSNSCDGPEERKSVW